MTGHIWLGWGTYGMPKEDIFEALPRVREIGYEAIEICVGIDWPTTPEELDEAARKRLVQTLNQCNFPTPALLGMLNLCAKDDERAAMLARFEANCRLARDLRVDAAWPVVTSTLGGAQPDWNREKERIRDDLLELADIAARDEVMFAVEPHVGGAFDTPEKAVWMMEQTDHDHLRLNFDISHFHVQGMDMALCIEECAPYAAHIHIKDGRMEDGRVKFVLPGEGDLDLAAYMKTLARVGVHAPVTVEVSGMVWKQPDYDPWKAARFCYEKLDEARRAAT